MPESRVKFIWEYSINKWVFCFFLSNGSIVLLLMMMMMELVAMSVFMPLLLLMRFWLRFAHDHKSVFNQILHLLSFEVSDFGQLLFQLLWRWLVISSLLTFLHKLWLVFLFFVIVFVLVVSVSISSLASWCSRSSSSYTSPILPLRLLLPFICLQFSSFLFLFNLFSCNDLLCLFRLLGNWLNSFGNLWLFHFFLHFFRLWCINFLCSFFLRLRWILNFRRSLLFSFISHFKKWFIAIVLDVLSNPISQFSVTNDFTECLIKRLNPFGNSLLFRRTD